MTDDPKPKRPLIAQILYSGLGGHGGVVFSMIRADREHGWRHALGFLGVEPLLASYRDEAAAAGAVFDYVRAVPRRPWRSYRSLYRWLAHTRPDAVLLHSPTALLPCLAYARTRRVPLIVVEHQNNALKTRQDRLFSRLSMRLADAVVVLTSRYAEELRAMLGRAWREDRVTTIPNGIDTALFAGAAPLADPRAIRIGMAARFTATKRFDLIIDMMAHLRAAAPEREWRLSLAGSGERWDAARARAAVDPAISFAGMLDGSTLADWYRGLDVYCHASDGETLSMSVLQAMAAGLPVVGSDVEGINNLLAGEPALGRVASSQTPAAFAREVMAIADDPKAARTMGAWANRAALDRFDDRAMFAAYRGIVTSLLTGI